MIVLLILFVLLFAVQLQSASDFTGLKCELPPFVNRLSSDAQQKLKSIWSNSPKDNCQQQHEATLALLHSLPHDEYDKVAVYFGGMPGFMRGLPSDVIAQFEKIWHNRSMDSKTKRAQFRLLAKDKLDDKQIDEFEAFERATDAKHESFEAKVSALSVEARTAHDTVQRLKHDERELLQHTSESVRREIMQLPNESQSHHDTDNDGLPNYLENASPTVQSQFRALWFDTTIDKETKTVKLQKLADTLLTAEQKKSFHKYLNDIDRAHQNVLTAISKLSPPARSVYDRLITIKKQEHDVIAKLSHSAVEELKAFGGDDL